MSLHRRTIPILIISVIAIGILAVTVIVVSALQPDSFQAMEYKEVSVKLVAPNGTIIIPQVPGYEAPSVRVGDAVPMFFRQCNLYGHAFDMTFNTEFVHQDTGLIYPVAVDMQAQVAEGCAQIRIDVPMTNDMLRDIDSQTRDIGGTWEFHGTIVPDLPDAEVTEFRSEQFIIVVDETS